MNILITAPNLDENKNVSGISSVVRQIVEYGGFDYTHFRAGRQDNETTNAGWFLKQFALPLAFGTEISRRRIDVVHINTALNPLSILRDLALVKAARSKNRPVLLHVHGGRFLAREFENKILAGIAGKMLRAASAVAVLSGLERDILRRRDPHLQIRVLENAVPLDKAKKPARRSDKKTIIFLGRLHEAKGLNEIVEACRVLKRENFDFRFLCYGAGAGKELFTTEMSTLLGDDFFYGGVAAGEAKWQALAASDIFLLPSRYGEGLPMAMLEAMAAGCAVIVSEMASIGAVVRDGENGFLIEPGSAAGLTGKLKMLLTERVDQKSLTENAVRTIRERFALDDYIEKLENIYRELKPRQR